MKKKLCFFLSVIAVLFCFSFQIKQDNKDIQFFVAPSFDTQSLVLNQSKYITTKNDTLSIITLKFYISNIILEYENGEVFKEPKSVHLIDVEEANTLNFKMKNTPNLKINKISFAIGIDSVTNVSGNFDGDLNPSLGMYWAWNSGYINMKLEGKSNSCKSLKKDFQFHIGGYLPKQNALQKVILNVPENATKIQIKVDVSKWLNEVSLKEINSVMIPSEKAIVMASYYKNMFKVNDEK